MSDNNSSESIGFFGLLTIVFIVLKLCNVIQWSWWWVLAGVWVPIAFILVIVVLVAIATFIVVIVDNFKFKKGK